MGKETLQSTEEKKELVLLIGVSLHKNDDTEESLRELEELVTTAGAVSAGYVIQSREAIHPGTYLYRKRKNRRGTGAFAGDGGYGRCL